MQKRIREQTNDIFEKIQRSLNKQIPTTDTTKLTDRRVESRYNHARR